MELRRAHGFDCRFLDAASLRRSWGFDAPAAMLTTPAAELDPYRLTHGLLQRAKRRGASVHDRTTVASYRATQRSVTLETLEGPLIKANRVVFATGYETLDFGPRDLTSVHSTFAMVTDPVDPASLWPKRSLVWETARPYLYLRTTADHRIIIGGGDIDSADAAKRDQLLPRKETWLERRLHALLPTMQFDRVFSWAGAFAETADALPIIGATPEFPRAHFALGYGGNGITFAVIAADILTGLLVDGTHPNADLFGFDRATVRRR